MAVHGDQASLYSRRPWLSGVRQSQASIRSRRPPGSHGVQGIQASGLATSFLDQVCYHTHAVAVTA